jgi:hypothetical protein
MTGRIVHADEDSGIGAPPLREGVRITGQRRESGIRVPVPRRNAAAEAVRHSVEAGR